MQIYDPAKVASDIWAAVARDAEGVYAKRSELLFALLQKVFPLPSIARSRCRRPVCACVLT